jgi:hypothetical protein
LVKSQDAAGYCSFDEELSDVKARLDDVRQSTALLEARYQELVTKSRPSKRSRPKSQGS